MFLVRGWRREKTTRRTKALNMKTNGDPTSRAQASKHHFTASEHTDEWLILLLEICRGRFWTARKVKWDLRWRENIPSSQIDASWILAREVASGHCLSILSRPYRTQKLFAIVVDLQKHPTLVVSLSLARLTNTRQFESNRNGNSIGCENRNQRLRSHRSIGLSLCSWTWRSSRRCQWFVSLPRLGRWRFVL